VRYVNQADAVGGYVTYNVATGVPLGTGEYIDKMEFWPLNNPGDTVAQLTAGTATEVRELPIGAQPIFLVYSQSWAEGVYPNGATIEHNDCSRFSATLSWENETQPGDFPGAAIDGNKTTLTLSAADVLQPVYFGHDVPYPYVNVALGAGQGGDRNPGNTIGAIIGLANYNNITATINNGGEWVDPVVLVFPPEICTIDTSQTLNLYKGADLSTSLGTVQIEGPIDTGYGPMYKLTLPLMSIPRTSAADADLYKIPLEYTIADGAPVETNYFLARSNINASPYAYPTKAGRLIGTSRIPNDLLYPADIAESYHLVSRCT